MSDLLKLNVRQRRFKRNYHNDKGQNAFYFMESRMTLTSKIGLERKPERGKP
jgi:hypothetical protein